MQIRDLGEDFRQIIDVDRPEFSIKFSDRLVNLGKRIREKKSRFVFRSGYFLVTEAALLKARWEYSRDSSNQSWDEIKSTK